MIAWLQKNDLDNAIKDFTKVIELASESASVYMARGTAWRLKGDMDNAIKDFTDAIRLQPKSTEAYLSRGTLRSEKGDLDDGIRDLTEAIQLDPNSPLACNNLAWILATCPNDKFRNGDKAVEYAKCGCEATEWKDAKCLDTLAAAYAEAGDFQEAIKWQEKAIEVTDDEKATGNYRKALDLYKEGKPYRDEAKK